MCTDVRSLGTAGRKFTNWARTYTCEPELYFEPETEDDIKQILDCARMKGKQVKVVGNGHSPSDIACTTDFMVSLRKLNKVIHVDEKTCLVTVQGGCLLSDLNHHILPRHNLAFSVLGAVCELTAAGVISTGTHGTGLHYGIFPTYVTSLRMITALGEVMTVSKDSNSDIFPAVVLGLGALGIITEVTFLCEPAFRLQQNQYPDTLNNVLENLDEYLTSADHFRFMWYPHTDFVVCYNASRTKKECQVKSSWFWDMFVGYYLLQMLLWFSTFLPSLVSVINRLYFRLQCGTASETVNRSDLIFNFNCLFKQYVTEWAISRDKVGVVLCELNEWIRLNKFPAHFPIEVRFVKADEIFLSPCYQQDSCYINIIMYKPFNKFVHHAKYWESYEGIMAKYGGRPHWAKAHKYTWSDLQKLYPKWQEFCGIRDRLDPNGMFLNSNLERVFNMRPTSNSTYI